MAAKVDELIQVPFGFSPRSYQKKLFEIMDGKIGEPDSRCLRALLRWHRRSGKDYCCLAYMFKEMVATPGVYFYFFPTYGQGRKALWEDVKEGKKLLDMLPDVKDSNGKSTLIKSKSSQEMKIELYNGSVFRVVGTDNIDTIVGTNPRGCVFSEYSLQDPLAWTFISPILAENGGWAIFNGTPRGRNHMYKLEQAALKWDDWYISALGVDDTLEARTPAQEEQLRLKIDQDREVNGDDFVEQEYWVAYGAASSGSFYMSNVERARTEGRIGHYPHMTHKYVDTFWDVGRVDNTAIWFRQVQDGRVVWIDYEQDTEKDFVDWVDILKKKGYNYRHHYVPHDTNRRHQALAGRTSVDIIRDLMREAGISYDVIHCPKDHNKLDGINRVREAFSSYFFNLPKTAEAIDMLSLYRRKFDKKTGRHLDGPLHDANSDCADALRTSVAPNVLTEDTRLANFNKINIQTDFNTFDY